jgi:competence protein ComEA
VYSLPLNARVVEAIKAAGGIKKGADTSDINQARILKDGEQIYVYPASTRSGGTSRAAVRKNGPIMINRATVKDFESLDGIGPVLANRIVTYRKTNGPFTAIEDLLKVPGIGQNKFAQFKEKLRV